MLASAAKLAAFNEARHPAFNLAGQTICSFNQQ